MLRASAVRGRRCRGSSETSRLLLPWAGCGRPTRLSPSAAGWTKAIAALPQPTPFTRPSAAASTTAVSGSTWSELEFKADLKQTIELDGSVLGQGSFASVYAGVVRGSGEPVAVKVLPKTRVGATRLDTLARIRKEVGFVHHDGVPLSSCVLHPQRRTEPGIWEAWCV